MTDTTKKLLMVLAVLVVVGAVVFIVMGGMSGMNGPERAKGETVKIPGGGAGARAAPPGAGD